MQALYVDTGRGPVDFTKFMLSWDRLSIQKNTPWLLDLSLVPVDGVPGWTEPTRGAYVRFEDSRYQSRFPGVPDGVVFTGYITEDPEYAFLGVGPDKQPIYGYRVVCTSDDYLINSHKVPSRTFINKTRGFILRSLLQDMFAGVQPFPFRIDTIMDGGTELIFQTDPKRPWTELAADFAKADGYVYFAIDKTIHYMPEPFGALMGSDPRYSLVIDEKDPRYNPDNVSIRQVSSDIVNDLTVLGLTEPTTVCREEFVSDGYQADHPLAFKPYGMDEASLIEDDFTGTDIDTSKWEERDEQFQNFIQAFEGSLNVIGGPGFDTGSVFLRSLKGIEMNGVIYFRDGEISFPPSTSGQGVIGGLFTEDDCKLANLFNGWYIDLNWPIGGPAIMPFHSGAADGTKYLNINTTRSYILRRYMASSYFMPMPRPVYDTITGKFISINTPPVNYMMVTWEVEEINADDPANVVKTKHTLLSQAFPAPAYVLYAPIVPFSCHLVMNNVSVTKPSQVTVTVDGVTQKVGSYMDGGRCAIVPDGNRAKVAWYAIQNTNPQMTEEERAGTEITTIPKQGAKVSVGYRRSDLSSARVRSDASILDEKRRFHDDGIRQLTLAPEETKPSPRTSEECLFIARSLLADRQTANYEGSYEFLTQENNVTELRVFPLPGDKISVRLDTPNGELDAVVDVTTVECQPVGKETYHFNLGVGPVDRFDLAQRELYRRRRSTLDQIEITPKEPERLEDLSQNGYIFVPDPVEPTIIQVTNDQFLVDMNSFGGTLPAGVSGYEVRNTDSGWGQTSGAVNRFATEQFWVPRDRRDRAYFVRPYRFDDFGQMKFSRRSAMLRVVYPRRNQTGIIGLDGQISPSAVDIFIPIPKDQDFAGILVQNADHSGLYQGDGIKHVSLPPSVSAFVENGRIVVRIDNNVAQLRVKQVFVYTYNLLGEVGPQTTVTISRFVPTITAPPAPDPYDPSTWKWSGSADNWRVNVFDQNDNLEDQFVLDGKTTSWNVGKSNRKSRVHVEPGDDFGYEDGQSGNNAADDGVPGAPLLNAAVVVVPGGQNEPYVRLDWVAGSNIQSLKHWELHVSSDPNFGDHATAIFDANLRQENWFAQGQTLYFKIRGENKFGVGAFSARVNGTTGQYLDPLTGSDSGLWDWLNPNLSPNVRAGGIVGRRMFEVSDGTGRSITGLSGDGSVALHLPFNIRHYNSLGSIFDIIRGDNDVRALASGQTTWDGSNRAFGALNSSFFLTSGILNVPLFDGVANRSIIHNALDVRSLASGQTTWDGSVRGFNGLNSAFWLQTALTASVFQVDQFGTGRVIVRRDHNVQDLANGGVVFDGSNRSLNAIATNFYVNTGLVFGAQMFNRFGIPVGVMRVDDPDSTLDKVRDGGSFFRTNRDQRDGGGRGFNGLDGNGYVRTGILNRFGNGYLGFVDIDDRCLRAWSAIAINGDRINDFKVDRYSMVDGAVVGIIINPVYRDRAGLPSDGGGFTRQV